MLSLIPLFRFSSGHFPFNASVGITFVISYHLCPGTIKSLVTLGEELESVKALQYMLEVRVANELELQSRLLIAPGRPLHMEKL